MSVMTFVTPLGPDMDTDGYTTPPNGGSGDGMYSPTPSTHHHTTTGSGYGGSGHTGGGYGGQPTPTPTASVSVATTPPTHPSLPVTGPNVGLVAGLAVVALLTGAGLVRAGRTQRHLVGSHRAAG